MNNFSKVRIILGVINEEKHNENKQRVNQKKIKKLDYKNETLKFFPEILNHFQFKSIRIKTKKEIFIMIY